MPPSHQERKANCMSTKVVTTETNYLARNNQFKVIVNSRTVEDPGIRMSPQIQIHRKQVEWAKLERQHQSTFKLIQYHQLLALETDNHIEARQSLEYVEMILIPQLHRIEREITAIRLQIDNLRARL